MAMINSVLGPLDTVDLGFTLCHEHVLETSAGIPQVYPELVDLEESATKAVADFRLAYSEGVRTIVDVTTIDLGRDVRYLERVSRESGVQIICATGIWLDIPRVFWNMTPDTLALLFIREIQEGIEGTGIKAGIIKVASAAGNVTPEERIILQAAARAQIATGVPITTHSPALKRVGVPQVRMLEEEGVDLNRVCVGHSDETNEMDYLLGLLEKGAWLGLDCFRLSMSSSEELTWEERAATTQKLIDAGFGHKIMLSHDWSITAPTFVMPGIPRGNPDGYLFISRKVLPRLREMGISEDMVNQIMVENPRRFFEGG